MNWTTQGDFAERRKQVFRLYVEQMFQRRGTTSLVFPNATIIDWLLWLAREDEWNIRQSVFLVEGLQPSWVGTSTKRTAYGPLAIFMGGLVGRLIEWASFGLIKMKFEGLFLIRLARRGFDRIRGFAESYLSSRDYKLEMGSFMEEDSSALDFRDVFGAGRRLCRRADLRTGRRAELRASRRIDRRTDRTDLRANRRTDAACRWRFRCRIGTKTAFSYRLRFYKPDFQTRGLFLRWTTLVRNRSAVLLFLLLDRICRAFTPNWEASRYETLLRCETEQNHVLPKDVLSFTKRSFGKDGMRINNCKRMVTYFPCTRITVGFKFAIRNSKGLLILSVDASAVAFRVGTP